MNAHVHDYPDGPALGRTDTSAEAARSISSASGRIQRMVHLAIAEVGARGLTSDELAERLGMERSTVQPRTSELKLLGLIRDSGQRRPNRNGKRAIVWTVVPASAALTGAVVGQGGAA
jgi:predicted transcriptional regulator